jgi:hypothetical protein
VKVNAGDPNNTSDQTSPAIGIDNGVTPNMVYIAWEDNRAGNKDIWLANSTDGTTWTPTRITDDTNDQSQPSIAIDPNGNVAYVAWTDARNLSTSGTDLYGASSDGLWENVPLVNTTSNQSSPAGAVGISDEGIVHLLWVGNASGYAQIFYGNDVNEPPIIGTNIIDEPNTVQGAPAIAVRETKVFACWQDERNVVNNNADTDIYFAESGSDFGTNILVNDDEGTFTQTAPAIGVDKDGNPYIVWVDNRNGNNDIYYAGATSIGEALAAKTVTASDPNTQYVQINEDSNNVDDVNDVVIEIPAGALAADTTITIAKVLNLPEPPSGGFGLCYDFGPSSLTFNKPVTISIPHDANDTHLPICHVYWYDPNMPASPWTEEGISDVQHLTHTDDPNVPSGVHVVRFNTTHFTIFGVGASSVGGVNRHHGGCAMSPYSQGNAVEFLLPYVAYIIVLLSIGWADARRQKTRRNVNEY